MDFDASKLKWTREPSDYSISADKIEITTIPHTDLWQRTYYHFRNDNAPVLQMENDEKFFSFTVKTEFESKHRFDQCGIVMYLDSEKRPCYNSLINIKGEFYEISECNTLYHCASYFTSHPYDNSRSKKH